MSIQEILGSPFFWIALGLAVQFLAYLMKIHVLYLAISIAFFILAVIKGVENDPALGSPFLYIALTGLWVLRGVIAMFNQRKLSPVLTSQKQRYFWAVVVMDVALIVAGLVYFLNTNNLIPGFLVYFLVLNIVSMPLLLIASRPKL
jgi:hypothetical protein